MTPIFVRYTWKTLQKNRSRTWVTIVGILLSTALVTAVTVSVASALHYFRQVAIEDVGDWSVCLYETTAQEQEQLLQDKRVEGLCSLRTVGYAQTDCEYEKKSYLFVGAVSDFFAGRMPVELIEGRLPENDREILLSRQFLYNSGWEIEVGDTLTLELGSRLAQSALNRVNDDTPGGGNGTPCRLTQHDPWQGEESMAPEYFAAEGGSVTYTVTGVYEEPEFEPSSAPGYTALTADRPAAGGPAEAEKENSEAIYELWIQLKDIGEAEGFLREWQKGGFRGETNRTLLKYSGYSGSSSMELLYSMAGILAVIVVAGSVALIYNAFSISVTERVRQFGLLKSLGATRRQIMGSVLMEGLMLCAVGIPLGVLTGCMGISATIWACRDLFETVLGNFSKTVVFSVHLTAPAMALSVGLGVFTVLLSAWLPARKALRLPAIEAIRQNQEVRIRAGRVRTSRWTLRLFGLPGMLASKNFKRSRRRYRVTIFSLFFSIVLFVCSGSFCHYLRKSVEDSQSVGTYDLAYYMWDNPQGLEELYEKLSAIPGVDESVLTDTRSMNIVVERENLTDEFKRNHDESQGTPWAFWGVVFVEDEDYRAFLTANDLDTSIYMDIEHPTALAFDRMGYSSSEAGYQVYDVLKEGAEELQILLPEKKEGYGTGSILLTEQGAQILYYKEDVKESQEPLAVPLEEGAQTILVTVGTRLLQAPWFCSGKDRPQIFLPAGVRDAWGLDKDWGSAFFLTGDESQAYEAMKEITKKSDGILSNNAQSARETKALLGLMEVFSTGFLALISLITTANVFNTISTNVLLRRREFAMLRSIGMTRGGIRRILNYECLLYGGKSLLYAAPVSAAISYMIYENIKQEGFFMGFYIPWQTLAIAVLAVFLIVFATMTYADKRLGRGELAGEIREENA